VAVTVIMPKLGLSMKEGTVVSWKVSEGDSVKQGAVIAEVMTEKITSKVEAPGDGVVLRILTPAKSKVLVSGVMAVIGEVGENIEELIAGAATAAAAAPSAAAGGKGRAPVARQATGPVHASPAAKKLAEEMGIDINMVVGTGPEGRITKDDVLSYEPEAEEAGGKELLKEIPYEGMRRAIGEHMAMSATIVPRVTLHGTADVQEARAFLAAANKDARKKDTISFTALLVKAVAAAIEKRPIVNSTLDNDVIKVWKSINVSVAVAVPDGLVVPVIRDANTKTLTQLSREVRDLAERARRNRLTPDEMSGGTFTITNLGGFGSVDSFTPIINQPECAILGVGRMVDSVVAKDGVPVVRRTLGLSLTIDHRVIDGAPGAEFLAVLINILSNPVRMLV
jgi:pyruvate dehydrogenase E2 component (dihydrolipoamide acetyltransferase)